MLANGDRSWRHIVCSTEFIKLTVLNVISRALNVTLHRGWRPPDVTPMNNGTVRINTIHKIHGIIYYVINSLVIEETKLLQRQRRR